MGAETCIKEKFITINDSDINMIKQEVNLIEKYKDVFDGLGKIGKTCKIKLKQDHSPKIHSPRRIPLQLKEALKSELGKLEGTIIRKMEKPTDWVSNLVVVRKPNGKLRICLDPHDLNKAIMRPHYPLPTLEQIINNLNNARIFSVLDAKNGYW